MIKRITTKPGTFTHDTLLQSTYDGFSRFNLIVGGNGVGKTTLLKQLSEQSEIELETSKPIQCHHYQNGTHNARHLAPSPFTKPDIAALALVQKVSAQELSEGQSILYSLLSFFDQLEQQCQAHPADSIVALLDEVDSGLTPEHLNMVAHLLAELLKKHSNLQFFIACNQFHWVYCFNRVLNLQTGQWQTIETYEAFLDLYLSQMQELGAKRGLKFLAKVPYLADKLN